MKKFIFCTLLIFSSLFLSALEWDWPLSDYRISSDFGYREGVVIGGAEFTVHLGVDLVPNIFKTNPKARVAVKNIGSGVVVVVFPPEGSVGWVKEKKVIFKGHSIYGGLIIIKHFDSKLGINIYSLYGHLKETWVKEGQVVKKGEAIGIVGSTGVSTGPHLHFSLLYQPLDLLKVLMN